MSIKAQLKINGKLEKCLIENGEITILPSELQKKKTGWERVEQGEIYHRTDPINFSPIREERDPTDELLFSKADYFSSEALAENFSRMQAIQRKMFRWQAENDIIINLNSNNKWCILYNSEVNPNIHINVSISNYGFLPYFSSKEKAQECIEVFKDELEWLFKEFRWRMD